MHYVSAHTVEAVLLGMQRVGVDVAAIRAHAALPPEPLTLEERWPREAFAVAWEQAMRQFPRPTLSVEVALAVPFGAFGVVDYLIASAGTVGGALHTLVGHFRGVTSNPSMARVDEAGGVRLEVRAEPHPLKWVSEEFTLATTLKCLRHVATGPLEVTEVCTTRPDPAPGALSARLGVQVRFDRPVASLLLAAGAETLPLRTADPQLHRAMAMLATSLHLGDAGDPLERSIRARLRDMLPHGEDGAAEVARALGMSERTLHRRLGERGTTWRAVIDSFRSDESKRLLREGRRALADIALAVGFSEQTAWTRAFRRWTGESPAQWARGRRPAAG